MQLIQFLAAWLFPGAQCFVVDMATAADSTELDLASSSSTPSLSANAAGSASCSVSSPSSTSSSDGRHSGFLKSQSRAQSPSTTPLCFGAGGGSAGAGRRLLRRSRARAPAKQQEEKDAAIMATKVKGDVVGRYLRKISRRLRKARSDGKGSPSPAAAAVDDTARERAESVARAISYCKDTLRRGTSRSRSRSPSRTPRPPTTPPSPSLDEWLSDRQEEIIASAAEQQCDECSGPRPSPTRPRRGRAAGGWPLGMQTMAKRFKESPCSATPSRESSLAAIAVAHGEESPQSHHGHGGCRGESSMGSLDEMEFLKSENISSFQEMINHHFITVEL